jgi:hypothetical protein
MPGQVHHRHFGELPHYLAIAFHEHQRSVLHSFSDLRPVSTRLPAMRLTPNAGRRMVSSKLFDVEDELSVLALQKLPNGERAHSHEAGYEMPVLGSLARPEAMTGRAPC